MLPFFPSLKSLNHLKTLENMIFTLFVDGSISLFTRYLCFLQLISLLFKMPSIIHVFTECPGFIHPPAPGNKTRPAKVWTMRSSCLEVQCHSWIGFASKSYFTRRAHIHGCSVGAWGHPRTLVQAPLPFEQCSSSCSCSHSRIQKNRTLMI